MSEKVRAGWHFAGMTAVLAIVAGCGGSPAMRAAEHGDWAALRARIADAHRTGKLTNAEATDLARKVARREITTAPANRAVARVRDVGGCARELDGVLASRMDTHDDAGAEAAWMRIDSGELGLGSARSYTGDTTDAWRAVGARGLSRKKDTQARLAAMGDGSPRVRRAAMRASAEADPDDATDAEVELLATVARVDPEGIVRSDAVRALASIGGEKVVGKLRDLWTNGDDGVREAIAVAWSSPRVYAHGGAAPLRLLVAAEHGPGAIEAASAAARRKEIDPGIRSSAVALLARTIVSGSRRDRLHAMSIAPLAEPDIVEAFRKAAKDGSRGSDREMEIAAQSRLLGSGPDRAAAIQVLEVRAGEDTGRMAVNARSALASVGHLRIQAWIERDLTAQDAWVRLQAAASLGALGRAARGAPLLADADPEVRTRAACTLIMASRIKSTNR
ncbi:HEAT repeat domain-containing protein [Pendulispora brunnea]|uniref:HEAT repeat domain-containing protein n=1 Tax=Pendulispora brunnea TaxID=2905690 RepID=A0ABZ2K316_9BACT